MSTRRFDFYNQTDAATADFLAWCKQLPSGRVVCVCITDTAIAKKRPLAKPVYNAFRLLGAEANLGDVPEGGEVIGYRNPFIFVGAKGLFITLTTLLTPDC